jgi:putative NADPH-quinone reductase
LVVIYPLWPGSMPAVLKGFFEQVFRPGFAIAREHARPWPGLLTGKSARIIVTMGMPASPTASRAWSEYSPVLRHQAGP